MLRNICLSAIVLSGAVASGAVAETGAYVAIGLSLTQIEDADIDGIDTDFGRQPGGYISTDTGYGVNVALGYDFASNWRGEIELGHRRADFERATAGALTDATTDGSYRQSALFANIYYDFVTVESGAFAGITPYLGAGLGLAHVKWNDAQTYNAVERVGHDSSDNSPAAQIILGFSYDVPNISGLSVTTELRHTRLLDDLTFEGRVLESRFGSFPINTDVSNKGQTEVIVGLRRSF